MQTLDDSSVSEKHVDWNARREKVREAFQVSWEGYEKEAWGKAHFRERLVSSIH
jgi:mannosyl-oligosaccharide alpha-1,2-mannosidase